MDLLGFSFLLALGAFPAVQESTGFPGSDAWKETWWELESLGRTAPGSADRRRIRAELEAFQARHERSARKRHDRQEVYRARVLAAQLARISEAPFQPVADPGVPLTWLPGEAWIAARVTGPGPTRVAAIEAALTEASSDQLGERMQFTFEVAQAQARDLHFEEAEALARSLHARLQASADHDIPPEDRSGTQVVGLLAYVSRMRGEHAEALAILERQLESTTESIERRGLLVEMARSRLAAGQQDPALRDLGEALALGSVDAGLLLGRSALSEGAASRARATFRGLLSGFERGTTPTPVMRGYGLSLLAAGTATGPSTRNLPDPTR